MKPWMIKLIIGAFGFGGGFAAGFFCHKKMNDLKFEEITSEEMAEYEKQMSDYAEEEEPNDISSEAPAEEKAQEWKPAVTEEGELGAAQKLEEDTDDLRKQLQGKRPYIQADADAKTAYEKLWKATAEYSSETNANAIPVSPVEEDKEGEKGTEATDEAEEESPGEEDFDEEFLEQLEREAVEAGNNFTEPPHQISLVDFYNDYTDYDKVTIEWFEPDNVWLDEHEDIIPDISSYAGIGVKNPFLEEAIDGDPDTRFWVNPRYGSVYEFVRHHRSYAEMTGG